MRLLRIDDQNRARRSDRHLTTDADALAALDDQSDDIGRMRMQVVAMPGEPRLQQTKVAEARMAPIFAHLPHHSILATVNPVQDARRPPSYSRGRSRKANPSRFYVGEAGEPNA